MEQSKLQNTYNGWRNRQTWNVALWINNDEYLYNSAVDFMRTYNHKCAYVSFIKHMGMQDERTPDRIKYLSTRLDYKALNEMMNEFKQE